MSKRLGVSRLRAKAGTRPHLVVPIEWTERRISQLMSPDDEHYIGYTMTDVARLLRTVFERRVRSLGLTRAQWVVIARIHRHPGLSQTEIADLLEIEKATAGRLIDRMELKGWLERRADPNDRRINRLHLTQEAERLHALIWPIAEATVGDALRDLSTTEQRTLSKLMRRVKQQLLELAENDPAVDDLPDEVPKQVRAAELTE